MCDDFFILLLNSPVVDYSFSLNLSGYSSKNTWSSHHIRLLLFLVLLCTDAVMSVSLTGFTWNTSELSSEPIENTLFVSYYYGGIVRLWLLF